MVPLRKLGSFGWALLTTAALISAYSARADEALADSYVDARELGQRDESDVATVSYHRDVLLPQFSARYRQLYRECNTDADPAQAVPFSFVAAIGEHGNVQRIWSDHITPIYSCVRGRLLFERFPAPPRAPFYLYIHMRFAP